MVIEQQLRLLLIRGTDIPEPVLPATILLPCPCGEQQQLSGTQWAATPTSPASSPSVCSPAVSTEDRPLLPQSRKPCSNTHDLMACCLSVQGFWVSSAGS